MRGKREPPLERSLRIEQVFGARLIENGLRLENTVGMLGNLRYQLCLCWKCRGGNPRVAKDDVITVKSV